MTYEYPEEVVRERNQALADARRENMAIQEMLAHVLAAHGKPVVINKEDLVGGKFEGKRIDIQDDIKSEQFIVSLVDND